MRVSAGIIPYRMVSGRPLFLLLRCYHYWDFPKGVVENQEELWETALRELKEETDLSPTRPINPARFKETKVYSKNKVARYYIAQVNQSEVKLSNEHHEFRWANYNQAKALLNERLQKILDWAFKELRP
ncbi:MAG: bis(5'-nucleosyl)-tetraphosphatase [Bacteriovoracaceae bacterium]